MWMRLPLKAHNSSKVPTIQAMFQATPWIGNYSCSNQTLRIWIYVESWLICRTITNHDNSKGFDKDTKHILNLEQKRIQFSKKNLEHN